MNNQSLKSMYNKAFEDGAFFSFSGIEEMKGILNQLDSWEGLDVLEIGCGTGRLCKMISLLGAKSVHGVDYSEKAIEIAREYPLENTVFECLNYKNLPVYYKFDVVVMQGVLEHLDEPYKELIDISKFLKPDGLIITSSPSFFNIRGIVWMTFELLLGVRMSIADLHQIDPFEISDVCAKNNLLILDMTSVDYDWGAGERTIIDFKKRFNSKIFQDKYQLKRENIDRFLKWFGVAITQMNDEKQISGANIIYKIKRLS